MNAVISRAGLLDDFFKDVGPGCFVKPLHGQSLSSQIRGDVKETPDAYTLQADVPGVAKDDIHVKVDGNVITLKAPTKLRVFCH